MISPFRPHLNALMGHRQNLFSIPVCLLYKGGGILARCKVNAELVQNFPYVFTQHRRCNVLSACLY